MGSLNTVRWGLLFATWLMLAGCPNTSPDDEHHGDALEAGTAGESSTVPDVDDNDNGDVDVSAPDGTERTDSGTDATDDDTIAGEDGTDAPNDAGTDGIDAEDASDVTGSDGTDSGDTSADGTDSSDTSADGTDTTDTAADATDTAADATDTAADATDTAADATDGANGTEAGIDSADTGADTVDSVDTTDSGMDASDDTDSGSDSMDAGSDGTAAGADGMDSSTGADGMDSSSGADGMDSSTGADGMDSSSGADGMDSSSGVDGSGDGGPGQEISCGLYQAACGGVCKNIAVDPLNCGGCGVVCTGSEVCSSSGCTTNGCLGTLAACDGACVDTLTDTAHCGGCGQACGAGQGCVSGNCVAATILPSPAECNDFESLVIPVGGEDVCLGEQAQVSFTWAICSCEGISFSNEVLTDAYDSTEGPYVPGGTGGGIGTNKGFASTNMLHVGGTLWSAGSAGITMGNISTVEHEFHSASNVTLTNVDTVGLDAYVNGHIMTSGQFSIGGTLTQSPGFFAQGNVTSAATVSAPVNVPPPCKCAPDELLPIASTIAAHASPQMNDNLAVGLSAGALVSPPGVASLVLPCGVYYLNGIASSQDVSIVATGNTALMIDGDVSVTGKLYISPAPGATLDVLIAGTFFASNKVVLGSPNYPAAMRVYVGGSSAINMSNNVTIGAYLYAMKAVVNFSHAVNIFGGLAVGALHASNTLNVHYDRAVLEASQDCAEPPVIGGTDGGTATDGTTPDECNDCRDCGNQACIDGYCGACEDNSDCCGPLHCYSGKCLSLGSMGVLP